MNFGTATSKFIVPQGNFYLIPDEEMKLGLPFRLFNNYPMRVKPIGVENDPNGALVNLDCDCGDSHGFGGGHELTVNPDQVKLWTEEELLAVRPSNYSIADTGPRRFQNSDSLPPSMLQRCSHFGRPPYTIVGDAVVVFIPASTHPSCRNILLECGNTFMTGNLWGYDEMGYANISTDLPSCIGPLAPYRYECCLDDRSPFLLWRGDYENLRQHPGYIESWLEWIDIVEYEPADFRMEKAAYIELLKASFDYISPVSYAEPED